MTITVLALLNKVKWRRLRPMQTNAVRAPRSKKKETGVLLDDGSGRKGKKEETVTVAARLPRSLHEYVMARAGERRGELTRVLLEMIQLHMQLAERLASDKIRIQRFALDEHLDWTTQEAEVYARLIKRGLEESGRRK
jgi:hypothetical protein